MARDTSRVSRGRYSRKALPRSSSSLMTALRSLKSRPHFQDVANVKVLKTAGNIGTALARNVGVRASTQPWVTFLDQDDWWPDNFLRELFDRKDGLDLALTAAPRREPGRGNVRPDGENAGC
jgi:glycosyltransferase involved in cell wall biosynthesis